MDYTDTLPLSRNRNYRLILLASTVSNLGDGVSAVAYPWLATLFTRDAAMIAVVAAASRLPWLLFALPAGVWTDRLDRQRLMVTADALRMVLTIAVVALAMARGSVGPAAVWALAGIAFLLGSAEVLRDNAAQTILPSVVAKPDLERANGTLWTAEQVMGQFAGPPLAGLLIAASVALPFGLDALSFGVAALLVSRVSLPPRAATPAQPFAAAFAEGARWMRANATVLRLAVMLGLVNLLYAGTGAVMVLYGQEVLGLSSAGFGLFMTAGALGGVAGGIFGPRLTERMGAQAGLLLSLALFAACPLVIGLTSSVTVAAVTMAVEGFASLWWNIVTVSYRQRTIPAPLLGRVNAIYRFFGWGTMPLGALAAGLAVSLLEPTLGRAHALHAPFLIAAAGGAALLAYGAARLRIG
jgi:MFS family permease